MRILFLFLITLMIAIIGCNQQGNYSKEIKILDSLHTEVEKAEEVFANIPHDTTVNTIRKIENDLSFVQRTYEGEMKKAPAKKLADYRAVSRILKNYNDRYKRIKSEIERTKTQLKGLKNALEVGATEDKEGNEISEDYVNKAFSQEKKIAENLIQEIYEMRDRVEMTHEKYTEFYPPVEPILDSLKRSTQ